MNQQRQNPNLGHKQNPIPDTVIITKPRQPEMPLQPRGGDDDDRLPLSSSARAAIGETRE
ncbi:MAG: hypothetical protein A3D39_00845 [Candidatus Buchananbacteria bacterium RIFCSPHIGHO2_02_FULL_39_17]|uniref:Uncharacterized protein n=1 Tax=Candidatus Buchananbacteria bacterium RIFCSPLOWO2_01_FULL_40_23b TaxID=1797544 RepID=A0A1G1YPJ2_9BACT|nr:MAG: hypothetical protein A3D39_00845 [Candidatus Buchananbacteria bacterium RIFCSPHIGHO2_02_FULL_39_17]OGY54285.1 MAG: hypothetical protein A2912_04580 [Candidatus Buchananbacteria bacterium RIFCSPLOWO2_01_FULL_40_23b]